MISEVDIVLRLLLGALLGALVGYERERQNQPAGLRTHMILAVGATLAMTISINMAFQFKPFISGGDPARLAAQVISGIGFLGAGAILRYGTSVKGLTTATSLWTIAVVGLAVGAGHYFAGVATSVLLLVILVILNEIEHRYIFSYTTVSVEVEAEDRPGLLDELKGAVEREKKKIISLSLHKDLVQHSITVTFMVRMRENDPVEVLADIFSGVQGVRSIRLD